jgi:hypothetical protein
VNDTELKILRSLRELPDGQLRSLHEQFLVELCELVREPRCPEVQADGIPCDSPQTDCVQCLKLKELLSTLRSVLPQS